MLPVKGQLAHAVLLILLLLRLQHQLQLLAQPLLLALQELLYLAYAHPYRSSKKNAAILFDTQRNIFDQLKL